MKMNVVSINGTAAPECTNCGYRFNTGCADNPYREMCQIALGKYSFCPKCGSKYEGCQIEGVDLNECDKYERDWLYRGQ